MFAALVGAEIPLAVRYLIALVAFFVAVTFIVWVAQRVLPRAFPPARGRGKSRVGRYPALRVVSYFLRLFGWVLISLGLLGFIAVFSGLGHVINQYAGEIGYGQLGGVMTALIISLSMFIFMSGLSYLAFGEIIKVFVDIALNTEPLLEIAQDTNYFYERLSTPVSSQ